MVFSCFIIYELFFPPGQEFINDKELDIGFKAITFGTYGTFGKSTHPLINKATADAQQRGGVQRSGPQEAKRLRLLAGDHS